VPPVRCTDGARRRRWPDDVVVLGRAIGLRPITQGYQPTGTTTFRRDGDGARMPLSIEDPGNEPFRAQATGATRAEILALAHFELQSVSGHGGGL